jgi:hypothetical protein
VTICSCPRRPNREAVLAPKPSKRARPEIEYVVVGGPEPGTWTEVPAMARARRDWLNAWEYWTAEAEEYREPDDELVLVLSTTSGRGKSSGLAVRQMYAHGANLFTFS